MKRVSAWVSTHLPILAILMFVTAGAVVSATGDKHLANGGLIDINGQNVTTLRDSSGNAYSASNPSSVSCTAANCTTKIGDGTNTATVPASGADATSNATPAVAAAAFNYGYNGATWDRLRSVTGTGGVGYLGTIIASGASGSGAQVNTATDATGASVVGLVTNGQNLGFNGTAWDRVRKDTYAAGPQWQTDGGASTTAIAANAASPQVIKASAGRLARIMVTSTAAAEIDCFDNASAASGTKIGVIASGAAAGTVATFEMPATAGITCGGGATYPGYTISYW